MASSYERIVYRLLQECRCIMQDGTVSLLPPGTCIETSTVASRILAAAWIPSHKRDLGKVQVPLDPRQPQTPVYRAVVRWALRSDIDAVSDALHIAKPGQPLILPRIRLFAHKNAVYPPILVPIPVFIPMTQEQGTAVSPLVSAHQSSGRTPGSGVTYPGEDFFIILCDVIDDLWKEGKGKIRPVITKIIKSPRWVDGMSRPQLYKRLKPYKTTPAKLVSTRKSIALSQSV